MKVLWVFGAGPVGGTETAMALALPALRRAGIRVEVTVPSPSPISAFFRRRGCRVRTWPAPLDGILVVHTHTYRFEPAMQARRLGIPHVWHAHGHPLRFLKDRWKLTAARQVRAMVALSARVLACSRSVRKQLAEPRARVLFHRGPWRVSAPGQRRRILVLANLHPWKEQHTVIRAMKGLGGGELLLAGGVGSRAYARRCRRLARGLPVRFLGYRADPSALIRSARVLVVPSVEGLSMALLEGMVHGKAVVAAQGGGGSELVCHGRTGMLFPPGDAKALRQCLQLLLGDEALCRRLGASARRSALRLPSPERFARSLASLYRALAGRASA